MPENTKSFNYYFKEKDMNSKFYFKKRMLIIINMAKNIKALMIKLDMTKRKKIHTNSTSILTQECNSNIEYDSALFYIFYYDFRKNNLKNYNITLKKFQ